MPIGKAKSAPPRHNYLTRNGPLVNEFNKMLEQDKAVREARAKAEAEKKKRERSASNSSTSQPKSQTRPISQRTVQPAVRSSRKRTPEIVEKEIAVLVQEINKLDEKIDKLNKEIEAYTIQQKSIISKYIGENELIQKEINELNIKKPLYYKTKIESLTKTRKDKESKYGRINLNIQNNINKVKENINKLKENQKKLDTEIAKKNREIGYLQNDKKMDSLTDGLKRARLNEPEEDLARALESMRVMSKVVIK